MAVKMSLFWVSLVLLVIGTNAAGELSILHSPDSLKFTGSSGILESLLKEVFSASLGLSVEESSEWNGLSISDPFNTPEAVVEVYVDGVSTLGTIAKGNAKITYPIITDVYEPDTFDEVNHRIKQRFSGGANKLVYMWLSDEKQVNEYSTLFGPIKTPEIPKQTLQHLKYNVEEDHQFLTELEVLKIIAAKVKFGAIPADSQPDFFTFRFRSLHALSDYHGPASLQTKEAKKMLGDALQELSDAFVKAYDGSVLVAVVTTDVAHTRRAPRAAINKDEGSLGYNKRQVDDMVKLADDEPAPTGAPATKPGIDVNLADSYSSDYPAIFNIILWFGVVYAFSLIAIVYVLMDMDPGRDSIIYRMTSTRMKKDN